MQQQQASAGKPTPASADATPFGADSLRRPADAPASGQRAAPAAGAAAAEDLAVRQLQFDDERQGNLGLDDLQTLVDELNRSRVEQGLGQVMLVPSAPGVAAAAAAASRGAAAGPSPLRATTADAAAQTPLTRAASAQAPASPLAAAAAGAAFSPQPLGAAPVDLEQMKRLQLQVAQLEAQVRSSSGPPPTPGVPAGSPYVTHKELDLVQENQALRQALQMATAGKGDGWVTTTRGGGSVDGDGAMGAEVWLPATALAGHGGWTPLVGIKTDGGGMLGAAAAGAACSAGTPPGLPRVLVGGTPASEGSSRTGHTPCSGPTTRAGGGGLNGARPPLGSGARASGSANASTGASPSRASSGGTPRERMMAGLQDSRSKIEQLGQVRGCAVRARCLACAVQARSLSGRQMCGTLCGALGAAARSRMRHLILTP